MVALIGGGAVASGTTANIALTACTCTGSAIGMIYGGIIGVANAVSHDVKVTEVAGAAGGWAAGALIGSFAAIKAGVVTPPEIVAGAAVSSIAGIATGGLTTFGVSLAAGLTTPSAVTAGILGGPLGWFVLGADPSPLKEGIYTFDCWKPILHDQSTQPSNGIFLKDIALDPRIKLITTDNDNPNALPSLILQNVWDEKFRIECIQLPTNQLAAHAIRI